MKHPDTFFLILLTFVSGLGQFIEGDAGSVSQEFGTVGTVIYSGSLVAGAAIIIVAIFLRDLIFAQYFELFGRVILVFACFIYLLAAYQILSTIILLPVLLVVGLFLSSGWRIWQLQTYLRYERTRLKLLKALLRGSD